MKNKMISRNDKRLKTMKTMKTNEKAMKNKDKRMIVNEKEKHLKSETIKKERKQKRNIKK